MRKERAMTKANILATLAMEYKSAHIVYASMEKQAKEAIAKGDTTAYETAKKRAASRAFTLHGIKRAAIALGIGEAEFMDAVTYLLNN